MDHSGHVEGLSPQDLNPDQELKGQKDRAPIKKTKWLNRFRGATGPLQWLFTNARPYLAADTSISAGTSGIEISKASVLGAQTIIRNAHARIDTELQIKHLRPEDLRFAAFHDDGWASRTDGSSQ